MNHRSIYLADAQLNESIFGIVAMIAIGTYFLIRKKFKTMTLRVQETQHRIISGQRCFIVWQ